MPPEITDENDSTLESSTEVNQDVAFAAEHGEDNGAQSSDAQGDTEGRSTLNVVQDVVKARTEEGSPPEAEQDGEKKPPSEADQEKENREIDNDPNLPVKTRKRIQHLLKENQSAKREVAAYKTDAEAYRAIDRFLSDHGGTHKDAAEAIQIYALSLTDPGAAFERLRPTLEQWLRASGGVLSLELKARVDSGELSMEAANEIAKANAKAEAAARGRESDAQRREREAQSAHATEMDRVIDSWEADRAAKDPNWEAKKQPVMEKLLWIHRTEGPAKTPADAVKQLDKAYKAVSGSNGTTAGRRQPAAPTVKDATQQVRRTSGASQQQRRQDEPAGALKHIQRIVSQRTAAA